MKQERKIFNKSIDFLKYIRYNYKVPQGNEDLERWLSWSKAHDWKSCNG